jgi:hypothetical protein
VGFTSHDNIRRANKLGRKMSVEGLVAKYRVDGAVCSGLGNETRWL